MTIGNTKTTAFSNNPKYMYVELAASVANQTVRQFASRVLGLQCLLVALLAIAWSLVQGGSAFISVVGGGLCAVLPNVVFVWRFFSVTDAQASQKIIMNFYSGEILKLVLSIGFLVGALLWLKHMQLLKVFALLSGFLIAQVAVLLLPWVNKR